MRTKNGRPLQVSGANVWTNNGGFLGRIVGEKVYDSNGRYVATIVNDVLVHRSSDGGSQVSAFVPPIDRVGTLQADSVGSAIWGDEPTLPD